MSSKLQACSTHKLQRILKLSTNNRIISVLVGILFTSFVQSSSATTVLTIAITNSGLITFNQALGIIIGSNIGTTITSHIVALHLTHYSLPIITIGFIIFFTSNNKYIKNIGLSIIGFGLLFLGLNIMKNSISPLTNNSILKNNFIKYSNNIFLSVLIGFISTAIIQSSSVTTSMVITIASFNLITLRGAISIIIGTNIGTCVTALLASIGTNIDSKRTAISHLLFNIITSIIFIPFISQFQKLIILTSDDIMRQCANAHTLFNIIGTIIFIPFINTFSKFITKIIKDKDNSNKIKYLNNGLLKSPSLAIESSIKEILNTLFITNKMIEYSIDGLFGKTKLLDKVDIMENHVDKRREKITEYLTKIMEQKLNHNESKKLPKLIHIVNDVEKIGDHCVNLKILAEKKYNNKLIFSDIAVGEIIEIYNLTINMIKETEDILLTSNIPKCKLIYKLENKLDDMKTNFRKNHIERLKNKKCNYLSGIVFIDIISNFEKIGDYLINIIEAYEIINNI